MPAPPTWRARASASARSSREDVQEDAVKKMFTPEFRNRLDAVVPFAYLPPAVVARVVDKFILQLELQLADRNVHIDLDDEAREWLTTKRLRQALRRAADGAADAGEDQAAAGRGIAVRQIGQRRRGQGPHQGQCPGVRDHAPPRPNRSRSRRKAKAAKRPRRKGRARDRRSRTARKPSLQRACVSGCLGGSGTIEIRVGIGAVSPDPVR